MLWYVKDNNNLPFRIAKKYIGYAGNNELIIETLSGFDYFNFIRKIYKIP